MDRSKLIDRIAKLLAVTMDRGATPQEAETAAKRAEAMMAEYNINEKDLTAEQATKSIVVERIRTHNRKWQRTIAISCADRFKCAAIACLDPMDTGILGYQHDVAIAIALASVLIKDIDTAAKKYDPGKVVVAESRSLFDAAAKEYSNPLLPHKSIAKQRNEFRNSAAVAVSERLYKLVVKPPSEASGTENALVIADAVERKLDEVTDGKSRTVEVTAQNEEGVRYGRSVSIDTSQVAADQRRRIGN